MYTAILVDDENFDLVGLKQLIPWTALNIEVAFATNSPFSALNFLQEQHADLLITDIRMPVMSGMELAKKSLEIHPALKIIFISGYEDFHYAKQALALQAGGYVLKPVDDEELIQVLSDMVNNLEAEKDRHRFLKGSKETHEFIKANFILHLLEGTMDEEKLAGVVKEFQVELPIGGICSAIIEIDDVLLAPENNLMEVNRVMNWLGDHITEQGIGLFCRVANYQLGILSECKEVELESKLQHLLQEVRQSTGRSVTIAIGEEAAEVHKAWVSFHKAKELLSLKMFVGKNKVITSALTKINTIKDMNDLNGILEALFAATANYKLVEIVDGVDELFSLVRGFEHKITVYNFAVYVITKMEAYLNQINTSLQKVLGWKMEDFDIIYRFDTIQDIKSWLYRTMFHISELLNVKKQNRNRKLFDEIERYIQNNLSNDLTLRDVANHFSYSSNHLGFLFKEQMGESFSDYIIRKKMAAAGELLQSPQWKVYEIADKLGYKSLTYFSRQFKEYYGISPGEYRNQG